MNKLNTIITDAQNKFYKKISYIIQNNLFDINMYKRFLNMQYHLTKGVQKHFFALASSESTTKRKKFRKWLINFGFEEEPHYLIAKSDLNNLGFEIQEAPLDIQLWWLYFDKKIDTAPLTRIGATSILENISSTATELIDKMLYSANDFIKPENTVFLKIHRHGPNLDHGNEVLNAINDCNFSDENLQDIINGAKTATIIYLRALDWVIHGDK